MVVVIPVNPCPKPRMTKSDRWKKRPATTRYWQFKDDLRVHVKGTLEPRFSVVFRVPMPKSWSNKKKAAMEGKPHQAKPDIDNYTKALMDALCEDDSYIYDTRQQKYWAYTGAIELEELE